MKPKILDLIDFERVDTLLEGFNKSTGFVTAILDLEGNVLSNSEWTQICSEFHRKNPETSKKCTISDTLLAGKLAKGEKYHFYQCLNGLIDVAIPIVIKGEHIANLFFGQFFFEKPDNSFFKKQAEKYGFNEKTYLKALGKIPIVSKEKVLAAMDFLQGMIQMISEITLQKLEQMELNEAIRKNERILRLFVEHSPAAIAMLDNDLRFLAVSHRFLVDYNLGDLEVIGLSFYEVFPEISESGKKIHRRCLAGETISARNDPFLRANGKTDWVRWEMLPWYESENQTGGIILFSEVITAQIEDREALRLSEEKFNKAFHISPHAIAISHASDGKFIDVNEALVNISGYSKEIIIGNSSLLLNLWYNPEERIKYVSLLKETGKVKNFETKFIISSGDIRDFLLSGEMFMFNNEYCILTILHEITELKKAEEALREKEEKYRSIYENSSVAILLTSPDGSILSANDFACQIFERTEKEICEEGRNGLMDSNDPRLPVMLEDRKKYGKIKCELTFLKKGGSKFQGEMSSVVFTDQKGKERTSMVIRDLTEQKQAEAEVRALTRTLEQRVVERTAQLEAVNKELETFTYSVSHDLKAPLRGIDGYSKLLNDLYGQDLNDEAKHFISTIRRSTQLMSQLIDDLLQYSRLERNQLRSEPVKIKPFIEAILKINEDEVISHRFSVATDIPDTTIIADSNGIQMALRNLIENAIKFTKTVPEPTIEIKQEETASSWILSVKDNGIGFEMKYSQRIFEIFQRLHRIEEYPGTGIGLAMVGKAMQRMNGKAWAVSDPGQGATFYLEIPKPI